MTFTDVETARKAYHEKFKKALTVSIIIALMIVIPSILIMPLASIIFIIIAIGVSAVILTFATLKEKNAYRKAYKGYFVEQNLSKIFTNLTYSHDRGFSSSVLAESCMMNLGDKYSSNDLTIAKYKKIGFAQADVTILKEYTDDKGNTHEYPIFKGRYMVFEFPKKFDYRLEVVGKRFRAYRVPGKIDGRKMSKLETESTDFNHNFKLFGQDGFESFYLLAPDVIAKIEDIAEQYNHKLLLGFYDNKLVVALDDGKDAFEPARFTRPIDEKAETEKVSREIKVITDFIDVISSH